MSNCKEIEIEASVPWDWAGQLPDSEGALFASLLLNPVIGVELEQWSTGYVGNEHGGQTHMYHVRIAGTEALAWPFLERLVRALASVGTITVAQAKDIENRGSRWEPITV